MRNYGKEKKVPYTVRQFAKYIYHLSLEAQKEKDKRKEEEKQNGLYDSEDDENDFEQTYLKKQKVDPEPSENQHIMVLPTGINSENVQHAYSEIDAFDIEELENSDLFKDLDEELR